MSNLIKFSRNKKARKRLVEERGIKMICKQFIKDKCHKEHCQYIHDKSLYPCMSLYGIGYCEKGPNCEFSHEPFLTERDIEEFIKDNEQFLIDIYKSRRETTLGYYFIKHLTKMKEINRSKFLKLRIQLPPQMPPYISPKLLLPKNNYQHINSSYLKNSARNQLSRMNKTGRNNHHQNNHHRVYNNEKAIRGSGILTGMGNHHQNNRSMSYQRGRGNHQNQNQKIKVDGSNLLSSLKMSHKLNNTPPSLNKLNKINGVMLNVFSDGKMRHPYNPEVHNIANTINLGLANQGAANFMRRNQRNDSSHRRQPQGYQPALYSNQKPQFGNSRPGIMNGFANGAERNDRQRMGVFNIPGLATGRTDNSRSLKSKRSGNPGSGGIPLINGLKMAAAQAVMNDSKRSAGGVGGGNKNFLLNQLNLGANQDSQGSMDGTRGVGPGFPQGGGSGGLLAKSMRSSKDRIAKIFARVKIPKKNTDENKKRLKQRMKKLRGMIFPTG